jgi:hypothetical protein
MRLVLAPGLPIFAQTADLAFAQREALVHVRVTTCRPGRLGFIRPQRRPGQLDEGVRLPAPERRLHPAGSLVVSRASEATHGLHMPAGHRQQHASKVKALNAGHPQLDAGREPVGFEPGRCRRGEVTTARTQMGEIQQAEASQHVVADLHSSSDRFLPEVGSFGRGPQHGVAESAKL